jgi:hypothetical protein
MKRRAIRRKPVYMRTKNGHLQHMLDDNWEPYCQGTFQTDWRSTGDISGTKMHNPVCRMCVYALARSEGMSKAEAKRKAGILSDGKTARQTRSVAQINKSESKQLGSAGKPRTKSFWQGQSFGAASPVRRIDPADYK